VIRSAYDREQSQIWIANDFGQVVTLSSKDALLLFRWFSDLFSHCQGCDQQVSPECLQAATYLRDVAPFRVQTAWLCPDCYQEIAGGSVHSSTQE